MTDIQTILQKIDNLQSNMSTGTLPLVKELKAELKKIEIKSITFKIKEHGRTGSRFGNKV